MILPDDKNPSIVWDPEKKKWVNTDGDEQAEESFKPPPKMGDMMSQAANAAALGGPPQQTAPSQANMVPQMPQQNQMPFMDPQQQQQLQQQQQQYVPTSSTPNTAPQQQQQQQQSQIGANPNNPAPAKTPTLQSNMFKKQRNRSMLFAADKLLYIGDVTMMNLFFELF